jgi:hypothetical protein
VRLHRELRGVHSIGWDLAITPAGACIIEGSDRWSGGIRMAADAAFKREFVRLCAAV